MERVTERMSRFQLLKFFSGKEKERKEEREKKEKERGRK